MKWGLSLSGGSAFGLASVGTLEVLEREGYRPDCIAGSSMGSVVGGLYSLGCPMEQIVSLTRYVRLRKLVRVARQPLKDGLHGGFLRQDITRVLQPIVGDACIGDCKLPFVCLAGRVKRPVPWLEILQPGFVETFLECVEPYVFPPETLLLSAMLASSAIPTIFSPVEIGNDTFIDLCNFGAIPAPALHETCRPDVIIATDTTSDFTEWMRPVLPPGWEAFIDAGKDAVKRDLVCCDLVICPGLAGNQFRFDKSSSFVAAGKVATEKALPRIRELLGPPKR